MKTKTLIASLALGLSLAMAPAFGADAPVKKKAAPTGKPSMAVDGRYHKYHGTQEQLDCGDCHDKVQQDILYLRRDDPMSPALAKEGQVDRKGCLLCHKPGGKPGGVPSFWGV
jgi:cytochrome c553